MRSVRIAIYTSITLRFLRRLLRKVMPTESKFRLPPGKPGDVIIFCYPERSDCVISVAILHAEVTADVDTLMYTLRVNMPHAVFSWASRTAYNFAASTSRRNVPLSRNENTLSDYFRVHELPDVVDKILLHQLGKGRYTVL